MVLQVKLTKVEIVWHAGTSWEIVIPNDNCSSYHGFPEYSYSRNTNYRVRFSTLPVIFESKLRIWIITNLRNVIVLKLFIIRKFDDIWYFVIELWKRLNKNYILMYISIVEQFSFYLFSLISKIKICSNLRIWILILILLNLSNLSNYKLFVHQFKHFKSIFK